MKKSIYILCLFCGSILTLSCTNDTVSNEFEEANGNIKSYEDILFSNGKTLKTQRSLDVFQCKEVAAVTAKI